MSAKICFCCSCEITYLLNNQKRQIFFHLFVVLNNFQMIYPWWHFCVTLPKFSPFEQMCSVLTTKTFLTAKTFFFHNCYHHCRHPVIIVVNIVIIIIVITVLIIVIIVIIINIYRIRCCPPPGKKYSLSSSSDSVNDFTEDARCSSSSFSSLVMTLLSLSL